MVSEPIDTLPQGVVYCLCDLADDKSKVQELMAPEIIRVFTELFFIMENLAEVTVCVRGGFNEKEK